MVKMKLGKTMASSPSSGTTDSGRSERVGIFIDNNSLFQALHRLGIDRRLDYKKLKDWLLQQRILVMVRFYCGEVRTDHQARRRFYDVLQRAGFDIIRVFQSRSREGNAAFDVSNCVRVDCDIAWDLCESLHECDRVILVSGSRELARVVVKIRERGVPVEVAFFEQECAPDLVRGATSFRNLCVDKLSLGCHRAAAEVSV